ncbi:family 43 glycosylhydrolase [Paenibacillus ferrarius]|uniref:family 43 glycosylhydrolase n=1 Tax=Paenibacillus ferrarius TaxID=1469647 RepID=UPI003D28688E
MGKEKDVARAALTIPLCFSLVLTSMLYAHTAADAATVPTVTINYTSEKQEIDGFGASNAWSTGIVQNLANPAQKEILDALFSTSNGAGLSMVRNRLPYDIVSESGVWNWNNWDINGTTWLFNKVKSDYNVNQFFTTPWTPPPFMKTGGTGTYGEIGGKLRTDKYQAYADFLADYVNGFKANKGIDLSAISIQNEPNWAPNYESATWTADDFHNFIKGYLKPTFTQKGVTAKLIMPEGLNFSEELAVPTLNDADSRERVDIIGVHQYAVNPKDPNLGAQWLVQTKQYNKKLWVTEASVGDPNDTTIRDGLYWAKMIHKDMTVAEVNAFNYWWLWNATKDSVNATGDKGALVTLHTNDSGAVTSYDFNKRLFTLGQYSRFIRPGYKRIDSDAAPASGIYTTAYKDPSNGKLVIVAINDNDSDTELAFNVTGKAIRSYSMYRTSTTENIANLGNTSLDGASNFQTTLKGKSVTTFYADVYTPSAKNPIIWADVPDVDVIRVNDTYYMTSTTMHMNPGVPIMKSKDLVNWEIVNYVYDILAANDKQTLSNGQNIYGQGSWASSIRYHNGKFYVVFASNDLGKTYIFQTTDIEKGPWEKYELAGGVYHDMSLLFDDDGRVYLVYGSGAIKIIELTSDATSIKAGGMNKTIIQNASAPGGTGGLGAEGSHIHKINGKYYIFNISWPSGSIRTELVHRADAIDGTYEGKIALRSGSSSNSAGIAQGGIVQAADGNWYGMLFQDYGSVGRIPYIVPMTWSQDGWPVFGDVNDTGIPALLSRSWVSSDSFDQRTGKVGAYHTAVAGGENDDNGSNLALVWQWNHNPDNRFWSLSDRPGFLRLTAGRTSTSLLDARNTLTQRTFGPESSGTIALDVSHMKDGDYAGIAAFQQNYGFVGVKMTGTGKSVVMVNGSSGAASEMASIPLTQDTIYLRTELDYRNRTDKANFYFSLDGERWAAIGNTLQMSYTLPHFMGYRFALFNFATKSTGGYVDFDYFNVNDKLTGSTYDTSLKSLQVNQASVPGFSPSTFSYTLDVPPGSTPPSVTAVPNDPNANVTITHATAVPGKAIVTVSGGGLQTAIYTINFNSPTVMAIEAEAAAENTANAYVYGTVNGHTWTLVDGLSTKAMQFTPDDGTSVTPGTDVASLAAGSRLNYKINFPTTGTYNIWVLAKSHSFQTDSLHVGVDNSYKFTSNGIQNVSNSQFRWINLSNGGTLVTGGTPLTITAGVHELNIWGRESGLIIDRIYLTTSGATTDPVWPEPKGAAATISADSSVKAGSSFTVAVSLDNLTQSVYAQDITLSYDTNVFDYVSAAGANSNIQIVTEDKTAAGKVRLLAASIGGVTGGSTPVMNLTFKVKAGVQNTTGTIAASGAKLGIAPEGTVIDATLSSKSIAVGSIDIVIDKTALTAAIANAQSLYDTAVVGTLPGQYPQAAKDALSAALIAAKAVKDSQNSSQAQVDSAVTVLANAVDTFKAAVVKEVSADLNKDGHIDVGDLAMVAYHYGKTSTSADWATAKAADVNNDNKIDIMDLAYVASKILN